MLRSYEIKLDILPSRTCILNHNKLLYAPKSDKDDWIYTLSFLSLLLFLTGGTCAPYERAAAEYTDNEDDTKDAGVKEIREVGSVVVEEPLEEFNDDGYTGKGNVVAGEGVGEILCR